MSESFPGGTSGKEPTASAGDIRHSASIPGLGISPGDGNGNPLQYSCLESPMDREAWWAAVYGVVQIRTQLKQLSSSSSLLSMTMQQTPEGSCIDHSSAKHWLWLHPWISLVLTHTWPQLRPPCSAASAAHLWFGCLVRLSLVSLHFTHSFI